MVSPDPAQAINRVETSSTRSLRGADTTIDNTDDEQRIVNPVTALKDRLDFRKWWKDGKTAEDFYKEKGLSELSFIAYVTRDYGALKKHPDYKKYLNFDEFLKKKELKKKKTAAS
ncbi:hypothetical protein PHYBOEH_008598 [Phytophthora boehmeriae]|uniref:RxLR effector protein n=1 Tax=Phytophthora boehmeriae TaxID=109152 RepID=A0A8T1VZU4_9STRA|nr:hypothetical protein PHYBOEH_008598 [Phytophthora boehmeriae]